MEYYFIRDKRNGKFLCGTGKHSVPKLYSLGSANQVVSFKKRMYINGYWQDKIPSTDNYEIVPIIITLKTENTC